MKKIAVFASGNGSNFQAIIDGIKKGRIRKAGVSLLVCDKPGAFCLKRAKKAGIKIALIERRHFSGKKAFEAEIMKRLKEEKISLICLAGFMRVLSADFVAEYKNRIFNIHPSLLPSFKGAHAVKDAFDYGVKVTGVTVHFVTAQLDAGPIIIQEAVEVDAADTQERLLQKIHKVEHKIYAKAVDFFCRGRLRVVRGKVKVLK